MLSKMLIKDMTAEAYFAHPAVNRSQLADLLQSPLHYWAKHVDPNRVKKDDSDNAAFRLGRAIHARVLEADRYSQDFGVGPAVSSRNAKAWKEAAAAFTGEMLLTVDEHQTVEGAAKSLMEYPISRRVLFESVGDNEVSAFGKDPGTGIELKCRIDRLMANGMLVDVKSTADASPSAFAKSCHNFGYALQAAHYLHTTEIATGCVPAGFGFVVVEKAPPYAVAVYRASEAFLEFGKAQYTKLLAELAEWLDKDPTQPWASYADEILLLDLPAWAYR
jgi:hypothetical protein